MENVDYENEHSIIAHLLQMEDILQSLRDKLRNDITIIRQCEAANIEVNNKIDDILEQIKKEIYAKLQKILDNCSLNKQKFFADANQYRNDAYQLYEENMEIARKIEEIKKQILRLELLIGKDQEFMNLTK